MSIYVITNSEIHDLAAYEKYKAAAPQYVARHGGEYCVRGGAFEVLVGDWRPTRLLVLKFPTRRTAVLAHGTKSATSHCAALANAHAVLLSSCDLRALMCSFAPNDNAAKSNASFASAFANAHAVPVRS